MIACKTHFATAASAPKLALGLRSLMAAALALFAAALPPQATQAQSALPSSMDELVQVEILDGGLSSDGTYTGALRLTLQEGWKTYWRAPGEAGIPPRFTWRGSRNVGEMSMTWPAPQVFSTSGYQTIGYHDQLILPLRITPEKTRPPCTSQGPDGARDLQGCLRAL